MTPDDSRGKLPALPSAVDQNLMELIRHVEDAGRYHVLVRMLKELEMLEQSKLRARRSRSKEAALRIIALEAQISEIRLLITQFINTR